MPLFCQHRVLYWTPFQRHGMYVLSAMLLSTGTFAAETTTPKHTASIADSSTLETVVVTATRREQSLQTVPIAVLSD